MRSPNVVVIYADDLGYGDLGCFGASDLDTPALDALSALGVRFGQWYSNSPVCSPSRASLLTGRYPARAGVENILAGSRDTAGLPPQPTLASELRERGYRTGIFGKWHLGVESSYGPLKRGFDTHFGFRAGCVDYYSHIYYWGGTNPTHDLWADDEEVWSDGEYLTTLLAERAAAFIESCGDQPFLCYVPFNAPHYPMHAPASYVSLFEHLPPERRIMAAMIKALDDGVALLLETLDRLGVRDDTIVFFSSDNGPSTEERNWLNGDEIAYRGGSAGGLRGSKGSVFEGGVRVPALLSWPGAVPAGVEFAGVGAMMDLVPTLLHAVDGSPPPSGDHDGVSLLPSLTSPSVQAEPRWIGWDYATQLAARSGDWKIVLGAREAMGPEVAARAALYDLAADPGERHDLSAAEPERFGALLAELLAWADGNAAVRGP
ncbi:sulfatase-like hydrolase/transferase [Jiangella sp. DSM 45060]|uniref:sulfatase-like hydrolase/transferase n=1 Tax=Jiangella sp. DSM 45060 TaxID=1798224 RepID=UPI00087C1A32|nr:sulfatase-like hydrolase/transferase [Jiangella sp. DSM 45060]SDS59153.1 Arylsulfatase A [Jiangella sp. DSM 45060]